MIKTVVDDQIWLVQQHHHAQVSGYLAAHWGGVNEFARPGYYPGSTNPETLRDEVVLGVAEHDNGWWEEEAMPRISGNDGLPVGLGEVASESSVNGFDSWRLGGFDRWRVGIDRVAQPHPYAALLISLHAYWLYAPAYDDLMDEEHQVFRHFIFGDNETVARFASDRQATRQFLDQELKRQAELRQRLSGDVTMAYSIDPQHLNPHVRLLQLMDSLSLFLARNDDGCNQLSHVPRASWDNRINISWRRMGDRQFELEPYPFDVNPLRVHVPARMIALNHATSAHEQGNPLTFFHSIPLSSIEFVLKQRN